MALIRWLSGGKAVQAIPGSSLSVARASIDDDCVDTFDFGTDWWATEISDDFKSREWAKRKPKDLFLFFKGDELVAGARLGFWNRPHPHRDSPDSARYYLVLSFGVNLPFQHKPDPGSAPPRTFASVILSFIEDTARQRPDCVGLSLHVREANTGARGVYRHHGYVEEPVMFSEDGRPTIEMRKPI